MEPKDFEPKGGHPKECENEESGDESSGPETFMLSENSGRDTGGRTKRSETRRANAQRSDIPFGNSVVKTLMMAPSSGRDTGGRKLRFDGPEVCTMMMAPSSGRSGRPIVESTESQDVGVKHPNIRCDFCKEMIVDGIRWKCVICSDFDMCEKCETELRWEEAGMLEGSGLKHIEGHPFMKIKDSRQLSGLSLSLQF